MSRPLRLEFPGALWHVTARGNERKAIYRDDEDRREWMELLGEVVVDWGWILHAYVLMHNHYHLLVETPDLTLSDGMRQLNGVYTQKFNRKHKRVGHLFQGRFKGILVAEGTHLIELLRYIVLNPVRAKLCRTAAQWPWSSYRATAGKASAPKWLEINRTLSLFSNSSRALGRRRYAEFVHSARDLEYKPWEQLRGQIYLGDEEFARAMQIRIEKESEAPEVPRSQRNPARPGLDRIASQACKLTGVDAVELKRQQRNETRMLTIWVGRHFHYSQRELGDMLGIGRAAAGRMETAAKQRLEHDAKLKSLLKRCLAELKYPR